MQIVGTDRRVGGKDVQINIEVEGSVSPYGETRDVTKKVVQSARDYFAEGMALAGFCAESMSENMSALSEKARPSEVELQLSIKLDAEAGAVLTRLGAEAQLQVTLKWASKPAG